eukprot:6733632-Prymnesium_polylepis.1
MVHLLRSGVWGGGSRAQGTRRPTMPADSHTAKIPISNPAPQVAVSLEMATKRRPRRRESPQTALSSLCSRPTVQRTRPEVSSGSVGEHRLHHAYHWWAKRVRMRHQYHLWKELQTVPPLPPVATAKRHGAGKEEFRIPGLMRDRQRGIQNSWLWRLQHTCPASVSCAMNSPSGIPP